MWTRSTITFAREVTDGFQDVVKIYQQYDGYPEDVGRKLAKWLLAKKICNGFNNEFNMSDANGACDLAAQYVRDFKKGVGDFYIYPIDIPNEEFDYNYRVMVRYSDKPLADCDELVTITIKRFAEQDPIFTGNPSQLLAFCLGLENKYV